MSDTAPPPPPVPPPTMPPAAVAEAARQAAAAAAVPPPPTSPTSAAGEGDAGDALARANREAADRRHELDQMTQRFQPFQNLNEGQLRFIQNFANAVATNNPNVVAELAQRALAATGRGTPAVPPQPTAYQPPPPPQPVWDQYSGQWVLPEQPAYSPPAAPYPYQQPPPYQPPYQQQPYQQVDDGLFEEDTPLDAEGIRQMVADLIAEQSEAQEVNRRVFAELDEARRSAGLKQGDMLDRAACAIAFAEGEERQRQRIPTRPIAEAYSSAIQQLRESVGAPAPQSNGGPAAVPPPPGVTPTPQTTTATTKSEQVAQATEVMRRLGTLT